VKTGYEISLQDFFRLCSDHRNEVAPLLRNWFGYEVIPAGKSFHLRDGDVEVSPEMVYENIQADPEWQGSIYRLAMTLWR